jgi:DNA-binding NtrC family response regulator
MAIAARLLIVDDEPDSSEFMKRLVEPRGYLVRTASSAAEARRVLDTWQPQLVLMDLMLPDADGLELLRAFKDASPESQVIMVTGYGSVPKAVEAMRSGALTFIEKPVEPDVVLAMLEKAGEKLELSAENRRLKEELREQTTFANLVARSDAMPPTAAGTFTIPPHHTLAEIEKLAILQTLERTRWNKRKAANILGVYRPTLYSKLRKYHLGRTPVASAPGNKDKATRG